MPNETLGSSRSVGVGVDERKLWAGGAASAIVVGLVALVSVLVSRWLFKLPVLAPRQDGAYGDVHTTALILVAMGAALVATALAHLLMIGTLRPRLFFGWIVALVTTIAVVFPFSTTAALDAKIATAIVNLAIGLAIGMLVGGVAERSLPRQVHWAFLRQPVACGPRRCTQLASGPLARVRRGPARPQPPQTPRIRGPKGPPPGRASASWTRHTPRSRQPP